MAGGSTDDGRRRCAADLRDAEPPEEGELVPGRDDDSDMDTDDYYNNHNHYSSSDDTDETTSDCNYARRSVDVVPASYGGASSAATAVVANNKGNAAASSSSSPVAAPVLACPICGKEFRSCKAVCGHMKVHQQGTTTGRRHEQQGIAGKTTKGIKRNAPVTGGWGGTGKRGWSGCWSKPAPASPNAQAQSDQSMAVVVANPNVVLRPMPLAFAAPNPLPVRMASATTPDQSSVPMAPSATPNRSSVPIASTMANVSDESSSAKKPMMRSDAMETTVVAGAANPPTEAVVHQAVVHQAAPRAPPSPTPAELHATSVHQQPIELPSPPPSHAEEERVQLAPVHDPHPIAPPPPLAVAGRQNPDGYTCNKCGVWFQTHQALGGHTAGHKTRELAAVPSRRDDKPEKVHECRYCGAVFSAGVQLGGHMRKHYTGAPIVPKKKPRLAIQQPLPPPAEQGALEPAPRPAVAGTLRLFGVNIEAGAQTPAAQEEGSAATTQAPSASPVGSSSSL